MQYFTFQYIFRQNPSNTFLAEEVCFVPSVTSSSAPQIAFEPCVQSPLLCMLCELSVAKTETQAQCYQRERHEELCHYMLFGQFIPTKYVLFLPGKKPCQ